MKMKVLSVVGLGTLATMCAIVGFSSAKDNVLTILPTKAAGLPYTAQFYGRVDIEDETKFLAYDATNKKMIETVNQSEAVYTLTWSDTTHITIDYGDNHIGCIANNTFGTSSTEWTVTNGLIGANDGTNDREIQWNSASNALCGRPYKHNDNYPQIYFYTQFELDAREGVCGFSGDRLAALQNLVYANAKPNQILEPIMNGTIVTPQPEEPQNASFILNGSNLTKTSSSSGYAGYNGSRVIEGYTITTSNVMVSGNNLQFRKPKDGAGTMTITREDGQDFTITFNAEGLTLDGNTITNTSTGVVYCTITLTLE